MTYNTDGIWRVADYVQNETLTITEKSALNKAVLDISTIFHRDQASIHNVAHVIFHRGFGSTSKGSHEHIRRGDFVQVLCSSSTHTTKFVNVSSNNAGSISFFLVGGTRRQKFLKSSNELDEPDIPLACSWR